MIKTKDDISEDIDIDDLVNKLNEFNIKWEDWKLSDKEFELHLEKENCKKWKDMCLDMFLWMEMYANTRDLDDDHTVVKMIQKYKKLEGMLP